MKFPQTDTDDSFCVTVLVTRQEYPRLFPVLRRLPKGKQRATRLRALAALGEQWEAETLLGQRPPAFADPSALSIHPPDEASVTAAAQMFAEPITD